MVKMLTITKKGQTTIPVEVRQFMGLPAEGGSIVLSIDPETNVCTLHPVPSFEAISAYASQFIPPGTPPLLNVRQYINENRTW
jgi:bifunctional DNA-binding transcriptional regulator/antitoxin component of YhaV-PrlF toxin-antitoxin module